MTIQEKLRGVIPALVTPLTVERNTDVQAIRTIARNAVNAGCNGVMLLGSAGEGTAIDDKNFCLAIESVVEEINGAYPVIVSTGAGSMDLVEKNNKAAKDFGGDAVLIVPPFYYNVSEEEVMDYYTELADKSQLPVMIYHMPQMTKINISLDAFKKLSQHENIIGVKDSSGDFVLSQKICFEVKNENFKVFQGRAPFFMASLIAGADGTMGPIPNIAPEIELALHQAIGDKDFEKAKKVQQLIFKMVGIFGYGTSQLNANLKGLMSRKGLCQKYPARTMKSISDEKIDVFEKIFDEI
ncbi:MAG: dihydrodipicolinate synthase family protein, partial [Clostridia bacterium]|nr:dihydrodipicolinate synthase family protein [Clostridia bacterium]